MALAQIPDDALRSKLATVCYSPIALAARAQGNVHIAYRAGAATLLSGSPLLTQIAMENAKALGSIEGDTNLDLTYHFVLVDTFRSVPRTMTELRGNAFERTVLRIFGLKTEKVIVRYGCQESDPPPNDFKIGGAAIEIWVYGSTRCPMTETATLLAKSR